MLQRAIVETYREKDHLRCDNAKNALYAQGCWTAKNLWAKALIAASYIQESTCNFEQSQHLTICGLEPNLTCLDFESTDVLHLYLSPKKERDRG